MGSKSHHQEASWVDNAMFIRVMRNTATYQEHCNTTPLQHYNAMFIRVMRNTATYQEHCNTAQLQHYNAMFIRVMRNTATYQEHCNTTQLQHYNAMLIRVTWNTATPWGTLQHYNTATLMRVTPVPCVISVTWLISHTCDMTHKSYVWHDSFSNASIAMHTSHTYDSPAYI